MTAPTPSHPASWITYHFAVLRAVPHPYLGTFVPVGVVVHARTAEYIAMRALGDADAIAARIPDVDAELMSRYLRSAERIVSGDPEGGPVAMLPPSERFHWLTAPRSDVLQASPVHAGLTADPARALAELYAQYVEGTSGGARGAGRPSRTRPYSG